MATEVAINTSITQKFINRLQARQADLSSCTELFANLTDHFTSLQNSLSEKSQTLDSQFQSLETDSKQALESLSLRETSIPERESAATARVQELKENAIAEFQKPVNFDNLPDSLKLFLRRMDSSGLLKLIICKRKEAASVLRAEISAAVREAVDSGVLILNAVDEFLSGKVEKRGVGDKRWACGLLVQAIYPEGSQYGGKLKRPPEFAKTVVDRAAKILYRWMVEQVDGGESGVWGASEAAMFLQIVVIFGLKSWLDEKFLMKLVMDHAAWRDMAKLAAAIGFGERMEEMIDDLVKNGKEIEAVYFAFESGLTEKFSPVTLINTHIRNSQENSAAVLKNGNSSVAAMEDAFKMKLNSIKAIIRCIEDHNLESDFSLEVFRNRAARMERKIIAITPTQPKSKRPLEKNSSRGQKPRPSRPAKTAKYSNPPPIRQQSSVTRYSGPFYYPTQSAGHSTAPYQLTYGTSHSQSPAPIPQQHYPVSGKNGSVSSLYPASSYGVRANYVAYDYRAVAPSAYPPSSYTQ